MGTPRPLHPQNNWEPGMLNTRFDPQWRRKNTCFPAWNAGSRYCLGAGDPFAICSADLIHLLWQRQISPKLSRMIIPDASLPRPLSLAPRFQRTYFYGRCHMYLMYCCPLCYFGPSHIKYQAIQLQNPTSWPHVLFKGDSK